MERYRERMDQELADQMKTARAAEENMQSQVAEQKLRIGELEFQMTQAEHAVNDTDRERFELLEREL